MGTVGAQEWVTLLLGLAGALITAAFRLWIYRLGQVWAALFVLVVSLILAAGAVALTGEPVKAPAVFLVAVFANEGVKTILRRRPADTK